MTTPLSPTSADPLDLELAQTVLDYLADHPAAMDTVEGIAEWWLQRQRIKVEVERVERVLRRQVEAGVLEAVGAEPRCRYRLRRLTSRSFVSQCVAAPQERRMKQSKED